MLTIPSFDSFLADMGDKKDEWYMVVDGLKLCDNYPPRTVQEVQEMAASLISASHDVTVAMLRDYHEWLVRQLAAKSVHLI